MGNNSSEAASASKASGQVYGGILLPFWGIFFQTRVDRMAATRQAAESCCVPQVTSWELGQKRSSWDVHVDCSTWIISGYSLGMLAGNGVLKK